MVKHYIRHTLSVQSPHTMDTILFCDVINVIADTSISNTCNMEIRLFIEHFHCVNLLTQFLVNSHFHCHFGEQPYGAFLS